MTKKVERSAKKILAEAGLERLANSDRYFLCTSPENYFNIHYTRSEIENRRKDHGDRFYIVVFQFNKGETTPFKFYVIPFLTIRELFERGVTENKFWLSIDPDRQTIGYRKKGRAGEAEVNTYPWSPERLELVLKGSPNQGKDTTIDTASGGNDIEIESERENYHRLQEIQARIGQSLFRKRVLERFDNRCCLTEITEKSLLVASHIVPWSADSTDTGLSESIRIDPANGLCLFILYDKLFDQGYFSVNDDGTILLSKNFCSFAPGLQIYLNQWHCR